MTETDTHEFIRAHAVKTVRLVFADQNAITRGKSVPAEIFLKNLNPAAAFFAPTVNAYALPSTLPRDLHAALDALANCPELVNGMGADFVHVYAAVKRAEWKKYIGTISEWEREKYFKLL